MSLRTASLEVAFLLLAAPLTIWWIRPPSPEALGAPSTTFSASRAANHLDWIAAEPRPSFSARNALVRQRLLDELIALGLEARTQTLPLAALPDSLERTANPNDDDPELVNILARLRGTGSGHAFLLAVHYDSVPDGPGAADDGAAVAALLETLRALGDRPRTNDLIVLLSDGEELGLLGAQAFAALDPWFTDVRAAANFEARGAGGPSILFQTGPESASLVERYARAAPHPFGSSLAAAVYERMPNDTDFTVFLRRGLPGLNFAFLGGGAVYHQPTDRADVLSRSSLQQHGEAMLAVARELLDADLDHLAEGELEFFPVPGGLARWPQRWTPFAAVALALCVTAACARRAPLAVVRGALRAVLVSGVAALVAIGLAYGAQALVHLLGVGSGSEPGANLCSSESLTVGAWWCALGIGLFLVRILEKTDARSPERQELARGSLARGALLVWSFLAVSLALAVPGGGHVGLCALLGAALAYAVRAHPPVTRARSLLACVLWLPAAIVLLVLQALLVQVGSVLPAAEFRLGGAMSGLVLLAALPLLERASGREPPARLAWRGAAGVLLAGAIVLVGSSVLRASGS